MSDNISFIIAIASSIGLISSEILPFIPMNGNGVIHSCFLYLSKLKPNSKNDENVKKEEEKNIITIDDNKEFLEKLDKIEKKLDKNNIGHTILIKQIKEKIDDIYLRLSV